MASQIKPPPMPSDEPLPMDYVACNLGPIHEDPALARQQLAGEEDQSVPSWDQGA